MIFINSIPKNVKLPLTTSETSYKCSVMSMCNVRINQHLMKKSVEKLPRNFKSDVSLTENVFNMFHLHVKHPKHAFQCESRNRPDHIGIVCIDHVCIIFKQHLIF